MSQAQMQALVALLGTLRKDWDLPGIRAAVVKAAELGTATEVAVAACRIAGSLEARTPGLIPQPGNHWQGTAVGARALPIMCLSHSDQPLGRCTVCDTEALAVDHEAGLRRVKDELARAKAEARARSTEAQQRAVAREAAREASKVTS